MVLNKDQVKSIIPHREPILLVDSVLELNGEESLVASYTVDPNLEIFKGHFPEEPIFPGVYTVESMAQSSGVLLLSCERYKGTIPLFLGINNVKFLSKIKPGDTINIHTKVLTEKAEKRIVTCACEVFNNGEKAAVGEVTLAMR